ncbi:MAG: hypothetical protein ABIA21_01035 [Candidatus Aenigmatarchaeota archaeon]
MTFYKTIAFCAALVLLPIGLGKADASTIMSCKSNTVNNIKMDECRLDYGSEDVAPDALTGFKRITKVGREGTRSLVVVYSRKGATIMEKGMHEKDIYFRHFDPAGNLARYPSLIDF